MHDMSGRGPMGLQVLKQTPLEVRRLTVSVSRVNTEAKLTSI